MSKEVNLDFKICTRCQVSQIKCNYLFDGEVCIKCVYTEKNERLNPPAKTHKSVECIMCGEEVPISRDKYCSHHCMIKSQRLKTKKWFLEKT